MQTAFPTRRERYGVAILSGVAGIFLRWLLNPVLGATVPFITLFLAVMFSSWYGGFGPGIVTSILGAGLAAVMILPPENTPGISGVENQVGFVIFLVVSFFMAGLGGTFRRVRQKAQLAYEEALRRWDQLRITVGSIGDAVLVADPEERITLINPVAEKLTGWSAPDAVGRPLHEVFRIVNEQTRQPAENPVSRVLREGAIVGLANHTILIGRNGWEIPIDDSAAPIRGSSGRLTGVVLVFRDITERRAAERATLHMAAIVHSSEDAILSKNLDGTITSWNAAAEQLYGYPAAEAIGKPVAMLVPPDKIPEHEKIMERLRRGESTHHFETARLTKEGRRIDVSVNVSAIRNPDGEVVGASTIARDITARRRAGEDRKRLERELRERADALALLVEASTALAGVVDYESSLQKVARAAVPHFADWCAVDLVGADGNLRRLAVAHVDPAKAQLAYDVMKHYPPSFDAPFGAYHVLRTGKPEMVSQISEKMLEERTLNPEHLHMVRELKPSSYMAVPLTRRGRTVGVLTFMAAESGRHYAERDLRIAEELAQRAAVAIDNAELYSELKESDRLKTEFLAMLAHELRNPLAPIRNALHIMKMPEADPQVIAAARNIAERQVQQLTRLVDDLLDVSRIMRGVIELRLEKVLLSTIVERAIETAQPLIAAGRHDLKVRLPEEPILLEGDLVRLSQALSNLLNNAAKYTEEGGDIELVANRDGAAVVITIRDTGIGIDPEMLPRIFEMFVQVDHTTARAQGGMGIGLSLVRRLVEMHGGSVRAQSAGLGKGSAFMVRLPVAATYGAAGAPAGEESSSPKNAEPAGPRPPSRVLVVDDNVDAADSIAVLLRLSGQEVEIAYDGFEALEVARRQKPDLVFLDIGMPRLDGFEVARRLRGDPDLSPAVIVAVTGWGQAEDRRRSEEAGFDYHLVKPVEPEAIESILRSLNGARAGRRNGT